MFKFNPITGKFDLVNKLTGVIKSIVAGDGLIKGGTESDVSLELDPNYFGLTKNKFEDGETLTIPAGYEYNVSNMVIEEGASVVIEEGGSLNTI